MHIIDAPDYPATERQKATWREYVDRKQLMFNIYDIFNLEKPDVPSIERTVHALIVRHESLRTIFAVKDDGLKQIILPVDNVNITLDHVVCNQVLFRKHKVHRVIHKVIRTLFDLETGPLLRLTLIHLGNNHAKLVVTMHHIISDANSKQIFKDDFFYYYQSFVNNQLVEKTPLLFQMKDFAGWEQNYFKTRQGKKNLSYWCNELNGDVIKFQLQDHWRRNKKLKLFWESNENGGEYVCFVSHHLLNSIKSLVLDLKTSKTCFFYVSLITLLYHLSQQKEIVIAIPISLRDRKELEKVICYMTTDVYLKMMVDETASFETMIAIASNKYFDALDHRHHQIDGVLDNQPCAAVLNELPAQNEPIGNFKPRFVTRNNGIKVVPPFIFMLTEYTNGLQINCVYQNEVISDRKIPLVCHKYIKLLETMVQNPSESIVNLLKTLSTQ